VTLVVVYTAWPSQNFFFCVLYCLVCCYCHACPLWWLMIHCMYSSSEMTGSMFDVAVLCRLVLWCGCCRVNYTKRKHFFMNILWPTEWCSLVVHTSSTVAILNTETSLWTCAFTCYLDCHEAGMCCYIVIHIENLLYPFQLLYFHLWPIYWLSLI
jgi:hypothetical protein